MGGRELDPDAACGIVAAEVAEAEACAAELADRGANAPDAVSLGPLRAGGGLAGADAGDDCLVRGRVLGHHVARGGGCAAAGHGLDRLGGGGAESVGGEVERIARRLDGRMDGREAREATGLDEGVDFGANGGRDVGGHDRSSPVGGLEAGGGAPRPVWIESSRSRHGTKGVRQDFSSSRETSPLARGGGRAAVGGSPVHEAAGRAQRSQGRRVGASLGARRVAAGGGGRAAAAGSGLVGGGLGRIRCGMGDGGRRDPWAGGGRRVPGPSVVGVGRGSRGRVREGYWLGGGSGVVGPEFKDIASGLQCWTR